MLEFQVHTYYEGAWTRIVSEVNARYPARCSVAYFRVHAVILGECVEILHLEVQASLRNDVLPVEQFGKVVAKGYVADAQVVAVLYVEVGEFPVDVRLQHARIFVACALACPTL